MKTTRSQLVPLLFIIASTLLLCGLGVWQLERLQWKNDLVARIEQAQRQPVLGGLPQLDTPVAADALAYRKVALTGRFLYGKTLHMAGRPKGLGSLQGFYMVTPFQLEDDGRIVMVNRGFSPVNKDARPEGAQTVTGVIRPPRGKRYFSPDNHPEKNVWFYEDITAMGDTTNLALIPLVVEAIGERKAGIWPMPHDGQISLRNDHLYYAITWFSIAIIGIIMFIVYTRKPQSPKATSKKQ